MDGRIWVVVALLSVAPATGSLIESTSDGIVTYQFDGDAHHDAPDTCSEASSEFAVPYGNTTDGMLVPVEDKADHFVVPVNQSLVGSRITISVFDPEADIDVVLDVRVPGCGGSVLDHDQQPADPPAHAEPGPGERSARLSNLAGGWECDPDAWFFVVNQVGGGAAPSSIHVVWTDGSRADVPLKKDTPATIAQYETDQHTDVTIQSASAILADDWSGRFNIGSGPCDATDGGTVFGPPAASSRDGDTISFTPTQEGMYVAALVLQEPEAFDPMGLLGPQPASCHTCVDALEDEAIPLEYDLEGEEEESESEHAA